MKDPYKILGVERGASDQDIKTAYHKLAMEHHPDRCGGDKKAEERFKEINEAYSLLSDSKKRASYDRDSSHGFPSVSDFFGERFNEFFHNTRVRRSDAPAKATLAVTLEEAYAGVRKKVRHHSRSRCVECAGRGFEVLQENCASCGGTGHLRGSAGPSISIWTTCPNCIGGRKRGSRCTSCGGAGARVSVRDLEVDVPAGVRHGEVLNSGGMRIAVAYSAHPRLKVDVRTLDVYSLEEIDVFEALLGGTLNVETLAGRMSVRIVPGIQNGNKLRIRGAGMRDSKGGKGNHIVELRIKIPKLDDRQRELLAELKARLYKKEQGPKEEK